MNKYYACTIENVQGLAEKNEDTKIDALEFVIHNLSYGNSSTGEKAERLFKKCK